MLEPNSVCFDESVFISVYSGECTYSVSIIFMVWWDYFYVNIT